MNVIRCQRWIVGLLAAIVLALGVSVHAEDEFKGQPALNEALQIKITANSLADLTKVIQLCETALKDGLSDTNTEFCNQLLAATLQQRGSIITEAIFGKVPPDPRWPEFRKIALEDLERAVQLEPKSPESLIAVARLNRLPGGDVKRAEEAINQAIDLAKDNQKLLARAYLVRSGMQESPEKRLEDVDAALKAMPGDNDILLARGALLADVGRLEDALNDLTESLQANPDSLPTLELLALVLQKMDRGDDALKILDQAISIQPDSLQLLIEKARLLATQDRLDDAVDVLSEADKKDPGNVSILVLRASVHEQNGNLDAAIEDIERVLRLAPNFPLGLRLHVALLAEKGEYDNALAELKKLQSLLDKAGETDPAVALQFALVYSAMKDYDKAIDAFDKILKDDAENMAALRGRADTYLGLGKQDEAKADYEKALTIAPDDAGVLNNLSWLLSTSPNDALRNGDRALELAEKAAEVTEYKQAHILSTLAAAYAEKGDFDKAREWSQKAVDTADADPTATEEIREALRKELDHYQKNEPWREEIPPAAAPDDASKSTDEPKADAGEETPPAEPETPDATPEPVAPSSLI